MVGISDWPAILLLLLILCGRHLWLASYSIVVADFMWQASLIGQLYCCCWFCVAGISDWPAILLLLLISCGRHLWLASWTVWGCWPLDTAMWRWVQERVSLCCAADLHQLLLTSCDALFNLATQQEQMSVASRNRTFPTWIGVRVGQEIQPTSFNTTHPTAVLNTTHPTTVLNTTHPTTQSQTPPTPQLS